MYIVVRDVVSVDQAITSTLRGARSRSLITAPVGPAAAPPETPAGVARRRNLGRRLVITALRPLLRRPLGRLRSYLSEPLNARGNALESQLDRQFDRISAERRHSEVALINLTRQLTALREDVAALRAELATALDEETTGDDG
jgi:hypothetical protein